MTRKPPRPRFKHFGIRYSQWGREYKSVCHHGDYESNYGTRTKAARSAADHVMNQHGVADGMELL